MAGAGAAHLRARASLALLALPVRRGVRMVAQPPGYGWSGRVGIQRARHDQRGFDMTSRSQADTEGPDDAHRRFPGTDDQTVEAAGRVSEAFEWIERARGCLYDFHQMIGRADFLVGDAADLLARAGHAELAQDLREDVIGRNVLTGRWTFQVVEEFDDTYYRPVAAMEQHVRDALMGGRRHVYEAELKERRRTHGRAGHEARPDDVAGPTGSTTTATEG